MQVVLVSTDTFIDSEQFKKTLLLQIKSYLSSKEISFDNIIMDQDWIIINTDDPITSADLISDFPGVNFTAIVDETNSNFDDLLKLIISVGKKIIFPNQSFKISVDVDGQVNFKTRDLETIASSRLISDLANYGSTTDEDSPSKTIYVKARSDKAYVFNVKYEGPGGIPVGLSGKAICPELGIVQTTLSNWTTVKMGFEPHFILFNLQPYSLNEQFLSSAKSILSIFQKTPLIESSVTMVSLGQELSTLFNLDQKNFPIIMRILLSRIINDVAMKTKCDYSSWFAGINENPIWLQNFILNTYQKNNIRLLFPDSTLTEKEITRNMHLSNLPINSFLDNDWFRKLDSTYTYSEMQDFDNSLKLSELSFKIMNNIKTVTINQNSDLDYLDLF